MAARKTKKSETLQVRLPYGMKKEFMERVQLENRSASDLIRDFIESYLAGPVEILKSPTAVMIRRRFIYPTLMAAGLVGAVIVFMPNPGSAGTLQSEFDVLDVDRDGYISGAEFRPPSPDAMMSPAPRASRTPRPGPDGIVMHAPDGSPLRARTLRPGETRDTVKAGPGEVLLTREQMMQHLLNYHDVDGDQKLSYDEYRASRVRGARGSFDRADADLDDKLSEDEYLRARIPTLNPEFLATLPPERQEMSRRSLEFTKSRVSAVFHAWDVDKDGYVTRQEMIPS
jgi:hypothetical protein